MKSKFIAILAAAVIIVGCGGGKQSGGKETEEKHVIGTDTVTETEVAEPTLAEAAVAPASIRVYIDNSGSMRGYARGENGREFGAGQVAFVNAISDMKSLKDGGQVFFWPDTAHAVSGNVAKALQGNRFQGADTPFPQMLATMCREAQNTSSLDFLVTDGIIGMKKSMTDVLLTSLGAVKNEIRDSIKGYADSGIAIAVIRLTGTYSSRDRGYVTHKGTGVNLNTPNRPFFIIAVGQRTAVQWLADKISSEGSLETYANADKVTFGLHGQHPALNLSDSRKFKTERGITKLKDKKGTFSLSSDLSPCLAKDLGMDYLRNNLDVELNGERLPRLDGWRNDDKHPQKGFFVDEKSIYVNHDQIRNLPNGENTITVRLAKKLPQEWIDKFNTDDDSDIATDSLKQESTFALRYLMQGIYEATDGDKPLIDTEFKFTKQK